MIRLYVGIVKISGTPLEPETSLLPRLDFSGHLGIFPHFMPVFASSIAPHRTPESSAEGATRPVKDGWLVYHKEYTHPNFPGLTTPGK